MEEILVSLLATWGPALASITAILVALLTAIAKIKEACNKLKDEDTIDVIHKETAELRQEVKEVLKENRELKKANKELKEALTHVRERD